jgi:type II secretory ATPase GspE/PulE/Tfp pilus assembly ATPase PilB-like protein
VSAKADLGLAILVIALVRLVQMGIEKYMVASTVLGVLAQRLVRRICSYCRESYVPNVKYLRRLGVSPAVLKSVDFKKGRGCERCHNTGYSGRVPIHELLVVDDRVRDGILRDVSNYQVRELAVQHAGMVTMSEDALYKAFKMETTFEEIVRMVPITSVPRSISQITKIVEA